MNSQAVAFIFFSLLFSGSVGAQAPLVGELLSAARSAMPRDLGDSELRSVLQRGLRHPAGNAVAVVIPRPEASLVLVLFGIRTVLSWPQMPAASRAATSGS